MAMLFKGWKTELNKKYVKKGETPNFLKEPKLEQFW